MGQTKLKDQGTGLGSCCSVQVQSSRLLGFYCSSTLAHGSQSSVIASMSALLRACCCTCIVLHLLCHSAVGGEFFPSQLEVLLLAVLCGPSRTSWRSGPQARARGAQCLDGAEDSAKLCIARNVVVWNGSVYLLHESSAEPDNLPSLRLAGWGPADSFNVTNYFKSGDPTQKSVLKTSACEVRTQLTSPEPEMFAFAAAPLDAMPFAGVQNVTRHAHAVLHHASLPSNHAHNFVETLPALFER